LRKPRGLVRLLVNLKKERRLRIPKHQPAEYNVTVIPGDEPLSEQVIQQVAKILLE
jgi:hypothetical protein